MATCPYCGDMGATFGDRCPSCGEDVPQEFLIAEELGEDDATRTSELGPAPIPVAPPPPPPILDRIEEAPTVLAPELDPEATMVDEAPPPLAPVLAPIAPSSRPTRGRRPVRAPRVRGKSRRRPPRDAAPLKLEPVDELPEVHAQLNLTSRFEYAAVPADDPPLMGLLLGIEALGNPIVRADAGPVAHVIFALDLSASMNSKAKYPVLKAAVSGMLDDLREEGAADVLVSVVIFSRFAQILIRDKLAREIDPRELFMQMELSPLCFGDYTDIAGALSHAGRVAFDQRRKNKVIPIRLYLLTDGRPQDMPRAREVAERLGKVTTDVHGLAFGSDADVSCLQELFAGKRGGTVKSVRPDTLDGAFERVGDLAQRVVATRSLITFELAPGVVGGDAFRYRPARVRFPVPAFRDGKVFHADLGTIEADREYQLLFEIRPQETNEVVSPVGRVTVQIPGFGGPISETLDLTLPRRSAGSLPPEVDRGVRTARDILSALSDEDPQTALRALRLRLDIYRKERRDPGLLAIIRRAVELLESKGSLEDLTPDEHATLLAHTCT